MARESATDFAVLAAELLRAVRGDRSQVAFSRRLGFRSNVAAAWEAGRRWPTAAGFFAACRAAKLDPARAAAVLVGDRAEGIGDLATPEGVAALLRELQGRQTIAAIAERAGVSRHQLSRWLSGRAEPRLPELLAVVDGASLRTLDLVAALVDPARLPSIAERHRRVEGARALARSSPWASAVLLSLELDRLPRGDVAGWIAERLGVERALVEGSLQLLVDAGLAEERGGTWLPVRSGAVDLRGATPRTDTKRFWAEVATERLDAGQHTWNLFVTSRAALERIATLQRTFYQQLRAEVRASRDREVVALWVAHLVPLERPEVP